MKKTLSPIDSTLVIAGLFALLCTADYFIFGHVPTPRALKIMGGVLVASFVARWLVMRQKAKE